MYEMYEMQFKIRTKFTEKVSKKIKKDEFSEWEAKGWLKGRKMKFL